MITKAQLASLRKEVYEFSEKNTLAAVVVRLNNEGRPSSMASGNLQELVFLHAYLGSIIHQLLGTTHNIGNVEKTSEP